jgi:general secretion pathway protein A
MAHRLAVAGWSGPLLFDRDAVQSIHQISRGVPRRINLLCDRALLGAYSQGQRRVNRAMVFKAAAEVFGSVPPIARWLPSLPRTTPKWAAAGLLALVVITLVVAFVLAIKLKP